VAEIPTDSGGVASGSVPPDATAQAAPSIDESADPFAQLRSVLRRSPFALFTDADGTISPLAATPQDAKLSLRARSLLGALSRRCHVVVISGRTLVDVRRLVGLRNVTYVGSHGLATYIDGRDELDPAVRPYVRYAQQAMAELAPLRRVDGILFEEKLTGVAIHYRLTRNAEQARADIMRAIAAAGSAAHFDLIEGVKVVELRPRLGINKGTSVRALVNRLRLEGLLYVGDDLTDVEAFEAIRDLRRGPNVDGVAVAVHHQEASPLVEAAADYVVDGIPGVELLLDHVLRALGGRLPGDELIGL
jgi:trehalose 6-phosphate phosphatase